MSWRDKSNIDCSHSWNSYVAGFNAFGCEIDNMTCNCQTPKSCEMNGKCLNFEGEPIPFFGWLKEDFGIQAAKAWSEIKFKVQEK